jgi:hypothetical protein
MPDNRSAKLLGITNREKLSIWKTEEEMAGENLLQQEWSKLDLIFVGDVTVKNIW